MTSAAVRGFTSIPIAPGTLFVPQPMSSTRAVCESTDGSTEVCDLIIDRLRTFRLDRSESSMNLLLSAFAFQIQPSVHSRIQILHLFFHFGITLVSLSVERAVVQCLPDRAARFILMTAVGEVAGRRNRLNVGERQIQ